jgi:hypothetical protein
MAVNDPSNPQPAPFGGVDPLASATQFKETAGNLRSIASEIVGMAQATDGLSTSINRTLRETAGSYENLASELSKTVGEQRNEQAILKENQKIRKAMVSLEIDRTILLEKAKTASKEELKDIKKTLEALYDGVDAIKAQAAGMTQVADQAKKIAVSAEKFSKIGDFLRGIPVVGNALGGAFDRAAAAAKDAASKGINPMAAGILEIGKSSVLPLLATLFASVDQKTGNIANQLNLSYDEASRVSMEFNKIARESDYAFQTGKKLVQANADLNKALGTAVMYSGDVAETFSIMSTRLGLSAEQAANMSKIQAQIGGNARDYLSNIVGEVRARNMATGLAIDEKAVLQDISGLSAATVLTLQQQGVNLASAAYKARQYGLNLQMIEASASSLLDFESSIANELEAELLTGREINLERARAAALMGRQDILADEIAKNVGSAAEFGRMNVIAQEALAKSLGMTRQDMGKMLLDQEALVKLKKQAGYEDIQGIDQAKQRYLQDVKTYGVEEARRRLGEGELADQMENMSIQERIAIAVEKLAELMENVVGGAKMLAIVLGGIAALRFTGLGNQLLNMTGIMGKLSGGAASAAAGMTRLASGSYVQGGQAFSAAGAPLRGAASSSVLAAAQRQTAGSMTGGMRMPGMGRIAGGLGLGVGAYGLSALQSNLAESGNETGAYAAGLGSSALTGASMGMMFGLPGALIGGALGLGYGLLTSDAPKLASGGIVTKPTLAHVGEGGQAEAVIPLNQLMSKLDKLGENKPANVYLGYHEVGTVMAGGAALTRNTYRI